MTTLPEIFALVKYLEAATQTRRVAVRAAFQSAVVPSFVWRPEQWQKIERVLW